MLLQRIKPTRNAESGTFILTQAGGNIKVSQDTSNVAGGEGFRYDVAKAEDNSLFLLVEAEGENASGYKFISTGHFNSKTVINTLGGEKKKYDVDVEAGFQPEGMEGVTAYPLSEVEASEEEKAEAEAPKKGKKAAALEAEEDR